MREGVDEDWAGDEGRGTVGEDMIYGRVRCEHDLRNVNLSETEERTIRAELRGRIEQRLHPQPSCCVQKLLQINQLASTLTPWNMT